MDTYELNELQSSGFSLDASPSGGIDPMEAFRNLSPQEQIKEGEDSLLAHVLEKAIQAHEKYPSLGMDQIDAFFSDSECLRYPTRYVYEFGAEMAPHQFAQPEPDYRLDDAKGWVIYLRPILKNRPDLAALALAYFIPVINYGDIVRDEHCLIYAASLLGLTEDECYDRLCELADYCGSEVKYVGENEQHAPPQSDFLQNSYQNCGCGSGGGCS